MSENDPFREEYYIKQDEWEKFDGYYQTLIDGDEKDKLKEIHNRIQNMNPAESEYKSADKYDYKIVRHIALELIDWRIKINEDQEFREKFLGTSGEVVTSEAQNTASKEESKNVSDSDGPIFISGSYFDHRHAHTAKTCEHFKTVEHAQKFINWYTRTNGDSVTHFEFKFKYDKIEAAFEIYRNNPYGSDLVETYVDCALRDSSSQVNIDLKFRLFMNIKDALERSMVFYIDLMKKKDCPLEEIKEHIKTKFGTFDQAYKNRLGWIANQKKHMDTLIADIKGMRADFDVFKDGGNAFVDTLCSGDCQMIWFYHADIKEVIKIITMIVEQGEKSGLGYELIIKEIYEKSQEFREAV